MPSWFWAPNHIEESGIKKQPREKGCFCLSRYLIQNETEAIRSVGITIRYGALVIAERSAHEFVSLRIGRQGCSSGFYL